MCNSNNFHKIHLKLFCRRDIDTGELMVYRDQGQRSTVQPLDERDEDDATATLSKDDIFSIIGHLENDERRLTAKLRRSPDLAAPISEAQQQLQRLKDLMFSIFGPRGTETEVDRQLNVSAGPEHSELKTTLLNGTKYNVESTRLDGGLHHTPHQFKQSNFIFSPIVFESETRVEDLVLTRPFSPLEEDSRPASATPLVDVTRPGEEGGTSDLSFTRYQLTDLTDRLGGTGLSYSKELNIFKNYLSLRKN